MLIILTVTVKAIIYDAVNFLFPTLTSTSDSNLDSAKPHPNRSNVPKSGMLYLFHIVGHILTTLIASEPESVKLHEKCAELQKKLVYCPVWAIIIKY